MELTRLIEALGHPTAYNHPVDTVEVCQTHISVVFLAGTYAYKIKKPLRLDFLDYSTLERRRQCCEQEVVLNRRLAPTTYLGVVPVTWSGSKLAIEGPGEVVEWAVKMVRLPETATLKQRLLHGQVRAEEVETLARRIVAFHAQAEAGPQVTAAARFDVVATNIRENFDQSQPHVSTGVSRHVFDALRQLMEDSLARNRPIIESRASRGVPRDGHGDLRLGHVYLFPDRQPPDDWVIVDCIEFDARYRYADPVADMAFLVMDFARHGRRDLGQAFADAYFQAAGDAEGRCLLPLYKAYRAAVRGKVEWLKHSQIELPEAERATALDKARAAWLLALGELETPASRPCLIMTGGLPGSGKSTLARTLADRSGFSVIRSDQVRKELAGQFGAPSTQANYAQGIYTREWDQQTYAECARRAEGLLFEGQRVLIDASFLREADRRAFFDLARRYGVPSLLLVCQTTPEVIHARLDNRRGDVSDADWSIYQHAAALWETPSPSTMAQAHILDSSGSPEDVYIQAVDALRNQGLES